MTKATRFGICGLYGALAAALSLGPATYALAWGQPQWVRQLGTTDIDEAYGVATDTDGNVYLTGDTSGSLGRPNQNYSYDAWVAKYSAAGALRWKRQLGTAGGDGALGVATDTDGNVYLTGVTNGSLGGPNQGDNDAWVAKYSAAGGVRWKRQLGTAVDDGASGVATDTDGNVYLTGTALGSLGGPNQGNYYAWVAQYSAAGALGWKRQLGAADDTGAGGVATDADGNVYLTGTTLGSLGGPNQGGYDAWVAKYTTGP